MRCRVAFLTVQRSPLTAALVTVAAGVVLAVQAQVNSSLGAALGNGFYAAAVSFTLGLVILLVGLLGKPSARLGLRRLAHYVRTGVTPWWALFAGVGGASVVVAQGVAVPHIGVSVFTMCFVAGQIVGGMLVDMTRLNPNGATRPTRRRLLGAVIVLAGVAVSTLAGDIGGFPLWAPLLPLTAGGLTSAQAAINGRVRQRVESGYAATTVNFASGALVATAVALVVGVQSGTVPALPAAGQWWLFLGGALGVIYIFTTSTTVARLGVLMLSLLSLVGSLAGSLVLDSLSPEASVSLFTVVAMVLVISGVLVTPQRTQWRQWMRMVRSPSRSA